MNDKDNEVFRSLVKIISQAREVNQDAVCFKAEVESRVNETVCVTYRLEIEVRK